jgi:hypothetical protein
MRRDTPQPLTHGSYVEAGPGVFLRTLSGRLPGSMQERATAAAAVTDALEAPMTAEKVTRLASVDPEQLADDLRVPLVQAWERADSWLQARKQRALAAVADATTRLGQPGEAARFDSITTRRPTAAGT